MTFSFRSNHQKLKHACTFTQGRRYLYVINTKKHVLLILLVIFETMKKHVQSHDVDKVTKSALLAWSWMQDGGCKARDDIIMKLGSHRAVGAASPADSSSGRCVEVSGWRPSTSSASGCQQGVYEKRAILHYWSFTTACHLTVSAQTPNVPRWPLPDVKKLSGCHLTLTIYCM